MSYAGVFHLPSRHIWNIDSTFKYKPTATCQKCGYQLKWDGKSIWYTPTKTRERFGTYFILKNCEEAKMQEALV